MTSPLPNTASAAESRHPAHWTLWVLQVLLAVFFLLAGFGHATLSIAEIAKSAPWAWDLPPALLRFIGGAEVAGALGLVLPMATGIAARLTWIAAAGLSLIMLLAAAFHLFRGEPIVIQLIVAAVAAVVARGRAKWNR
jgi:uncharacterized membrane protein YphA (DoxX/SURF4 family)